MKPQARPWYHKISLILKYLAGGGGGGGEELVITGRGHLRLQNISK